MASRQKYDVSHRPDGNWEVKQQGAERASGVFERKADAVERGRELARAAQRGQLFIRGTDGRIQTEHTYGDDPFPPKG
jgi:hypothetical protein